MSTYASGEKTGLPSTNPGHNIESPSNSEEATALSKLSFMDRLLIQHLPERFTVLATLGRGTYGNVYLALDQRLKREVAIKVLRPEWMTVENSKNRFLRESRAAARLNHSAIVRVIEADENSKIAWQVSDAIRGQSLAAWLQNGPLEPKVAAKLVADLANAVHCAHTHGVVHRDIKPENILVELQNDSKQLASNRTESTQAQENKTDKPQQALREAKVYLTDFGLAKIQDESIDQSGSTTLLGTPRYMAPEQFDLTGNRALPSADIFALGAILFECLTGRSAFEGASSLTQRLALGLTHHPNPRSVTPSLSKDLDTICHRALHPNATKRYATAAEMADDLDCYLRGRPIKARPQTALETFGRLVFEHQSLAVVTAAIIVCLAVVSIVSWQSQREMQAQNAVLERVNRELAAAKDRLEKLVENSDALREQAESEQRRFAEFAWLAGIRQAYRYWESSEFWETKQSLATLTESHHDASQRLDWQLLSSDLNHQYQSLVKLDKSIEEVRAIPGKSQVAFVSSNGQLYLYDLDSRQIVREIPSELPSLNALAVDPTGAYLLFGGVTYPNRHIASIYRHDLDTGETKEILQGFVTTVESIEISHDGQNMLCASRYRPARVYDLKNLSYREYPAERRNLWLTQTNANRKFIFQKDNLVLSVVDQDSESSTPSIAQDIQIPNGVQCGEGIRGTSLVAVTHGNGDFISLFDLETNQTVAQLKGDKINNCRSLLSSDDGHVLFCATESGRVLAWSIRIHDRRLPSSVLAASYSETTSPLVIQPTKAWHLADSPILSMALVERRLVCGTQSGDLIELDVGDIIYSDQNLLASSLNNSSSEDSLRELEVRLDSACQVACYRTPSGRVVANDLLSVYRSGEQNNRSNHPTASFTQLNVIELFPFSQLNGGQVFSSPPEVGGLLTDGSKAFAFLKDRNHLQILRDNESREIPIQIDTEDKLVLLGVERDCKSVAICAGRDLFVIDLAEKIGEARKIISLAGAPWAVAWHPDGNRIVVGGDFLNLYEVDLQSLQSKVASNTPTLTNHLTYVNDGNAILSAHTEGSLRYTDLKSNECRSISPHKCLITALTMNRSGTIGLSIDDENNVAVWTLPQLEYIGQLMKGQAHHGRSSFVRPAMRLAEDDNQLVIVYNDSQQPVIQLRQLDFHGF